MDRVAAVRPAERVRSDQDGGEVEDDERTGEGSETDGVAVVRALIGRVGAGRALVWLVVCAFAWWAVSLAPFPLVATVVALLAGVTAAAVGAHGRHGARPPAGSRHVGWWAALVAAAATVQLTAYLQHPRDDHPTISSLTNALLDSHAARAVAFVAWLAAMVELARR